jgi:hypothetical protein
MKPPETLRNGLQNTSEQIASSKMQQFMRKDRHQKLRKAGKQLRAVCRWNVSR